MATHISSAPYRSRTMCAARSRPRCHSPSGTAPLPTGSRVFRRSSARTYALANRGRHADDGFDLCSTTHCQVYRSPDLQSAAVARRVARAVEETRGLIISDGNGPIQALFHADCGGQTSSATAVWGGPAPAYLGGVRDSFCLTTPRDDWRLALDRDHLRRILNTASDTAVGGRLDQIAVLSRDPAGRATRVRVAGETHHVIRGERLRAVISRQLGPRAFRSARFSVERQADRNPVLGSGLRTRRGAVSNRRHCPRTARRIGRRHPRALLSRNLARPIPRRNHPAARSRHPAGSAHQAPVACPAALGAGRRFRRQVRPAVRSGVQDLVPVESSRFAQASHRHPYYNEHESQR